MFMNVPSLSLKGIMGRTPNPYQPINDVYFAVESNFGIDWR